MRYPILFENVQRLMRQLNLDQERLGERVGASQGSVSRWGESMPRGSTLTGLAELAGVTPKQFLDEPIPERPLGTRPVRVTGFVGAGAAVYAYEVAGLNTDQPTIDIPVEVEGNAAVAVKGDSLVPDAPEGWHVVYVGGKTADAKSLAGHLCVVQLEDGRSLVKTVEYGKEPGTFDLLSPNAPAMRGERLIWGARVTAIIPR